MNTSVQVRPLKVHADNRGTLAEILRCDTPDFTKFGQVYTVRSIESQTVRAFHRHKKMYDWFYIVEGSAQFVFVEEIPTTPTVCYDHDVVVCTQQNPQVITVPPNVWHGWMNLEPNTKLISVASEPYKADAPDEERVDPYYFVMNFDKNQVDTFDAHTTFAWKSFWEIESK